MKNITELEFIESFFVDNALLQQQDRFYYFFKNGSRYYVDREGNINIGVTSFLSAMLPMPLQLLEYQLKIGKEESQRILKERALQGSLFHHLVAQILLVFKSTNTYEVPLLIPDIKTRVKSYFEKHAGTVEDINLYELQMDMAAFAAWCEKYEPDPIIIETPLHVDCTRINCTLDLVAWINYEESGFFGDFYKSGEKKGMPKETKRKVRKLAIIDFKTKIKKDETDAAKVIGESNKWQLNYQLKAFLDTFPQFAGEEISLFNCITRNWQVNPDMQFTEVNIIPFSVLMNFYELSEYINPYLTHKVAESKKRSFSEYTGNINDSISIISFKDYVITKIKNYEQSNN